MREWLSKLEPKWVLTNIIGWSFLAVVLYAVYTGMVLPAQNEHFKLVDQVTITQKELAATQGKQTIILERIDRNTSK